MKGVMFRYQEHAESFSHDAVEEVEGGVSCHHEEVGEEEELSAAVIQQSVVLTAEQRLIRILEKTETEKWRFIHLLEKTHPGLTEINSGLINPRRRQC